MIDVLWRRFRLLLWIGLFMIIVHVINVFSGMALAQLGVLPRHQHSLLLVLTAPFIHGSWLHLLNNLLGLGIFSALCLLRSVPYYLLGSLFIIVVSGLLVWVFGRGSLHIGASGWIFGLWSLCIANAWFERSMANLLIAVVVISYYGGMVHGVLPHDPDISFEYHFFGALSGILYALLSSQFPRRVKKSDV